MREHSSRFMHEGGIGSSKSNPPLLYRLFRWLFKFITSIWFREINVVDDEYISDEAGVLFLTWHPNGLIDPMLMTARLPGKLSTLVHHGMFRVPFVGWVFRKAGVIPFGMKSKGRVNIGLGPTTSEVLDEMSEELASGGQVLMFPEESTHDHATVQRVRSGAARILLSASRQADAAGKPRPRVVPVGLHYSASHVFRERAAIVLERAMQLPPMPTEGSNTADADQAWVATVTKALEVELKRANLSKTSWEERTLIWKGRALVRAEKQRQAGQAVGRVSYAEAIVGARRLRAGWEYMAEHEPEVTQQLVHDCQHHFDDLEARSVSPYDIDARPEEVTNFGAVKAFGSWVWALIWMFGLVTWGAMIGNYAPYKFQSLLERFTRRAGVNDSMQGSIKVLTSVVLFPLWWLTLAITLTWLLLDPLSPLHQAFAAHQVLRFVTLLPAAGMFIVFILFWPLSARAHMNLFARWLRASRRLRQWQAWQDESKDWDRLVVRQQELAARLVGLGATLVLPGDIDWVEPTSGTDDATAVHRRLQVVNG